jgi:hypothetical protein
MRKHERDAFRAFVSFVFFVFPTADPCAPHHRRRHYWTGETALIVGRWPAADCSSWPVEPNEQPAPVAALNEPGAPVAPSAEAAPNGALVPTPAVPAGQLHLLDAREPHARSSERPRGRSAAAVRASPGSAIRHAAGLGRSPAACSGGARPAAGSVPYEPATPDAAPVQPARYWAGPPWPVSLQPGGAVRPNWLRALRQQAPAPCRPASCRDAPGPDRKRC